MDIKTLLHIRIIRIRIGSDAEIIHTTFIPTPEIQPVVSLESVLLCMRILFLEKLFYLWKILVNPYFLQKIQNLFQKFSKILNSVQG
jgi:hypothetical protein